MGLKHWFPSTQLVGGQLVPQPTPQRTTPPVACPRRKRQRGTNEPSSRSGALPIEQSPSLVSIVARTQQARDTSSEVRPADQPVIIRSNVASTFIPPSSRW
nr:hypothetical protein CFP56_26992 [Quercus suber]